MDDATPRRPTGADAISGEYFRRDRAAHLQANQLKPWLKQQWCILTVGADFVWRMEALLALYARPYEPSEPVVCFDERPC